MKPIDEQRFLRELHGDFREVDAEIRASWIKAFVFAAALIALLCLATVVTTQS